MENVLIETKKYASNLLRNELSKDFLYHNLFHTESVVTNAIEIAIAENISTTDIQLIEISAWFHDLGYTRSIHNHEEESVTIATEFLKQHHVNESDITTINQLILATKIDYSPTNLLEKVIRDADCAHFGKKSFFDISELLRAEWNITLNKKFSEKEWILENISFFTKHHEFYTDYAIKRWQKRKHKNVTKLIKKITQPDTNKLELKKKEIQLKKEKATTPNRGIETMFRVTLRNHITLSDIADTKANILLSVNAIIISLVLSNLVSKLDNNSNGYLVIPTLIFVLFTVISMILSVIATRPNVTSGEFSREDIKNKKVNLLFFGNFHKMSLPDFEWAIGEVMKDKDYLYSSMKKDLYFLGKVLHRKYRILRITYTVFILGIVISVFSFALAFKLSGN